MRNSMRYAAIAIVAVVGACSGGDQADVADTAAKQVEAAAAPASPARMVSTASGDSLGITSRSGEVLLSFAQDSVAMGFSPATLEKIRRGTDTARSGTGFSGMIERTVKSSVQTMLSKRVTVPVDDIEGVKYEDGAIRFTYRKPPNGMKLEDIKIDKQKALESFTEEDARLFVKTVEARLQAR